MASQQIDHTPSEREVLLEILMFRKFSTIATLAVLVYEYIVTFRQELRYIWRKPFNHVLGAYIFSRYFGLIIQSVNVFLVLGPLSGIGTPEKVCKAWIGFQMAGVCILLSVLDYILMLRIYALHLRSLKVGLFLMISYIFFLCITVACAPIFVVSVPYNSICVSEKVHTLCFIVYGSALWAVHIAMACLTAVKWNHSILGAPIARLVHRDSAWALSLICVVFAVLVPYNIKSQSGKPESQYMWPACFFSIACCRVIMNMQTIEPQIPDDQENLTDIERDPTDHITLQVLPVPTGHETGPSTQNYNPTRVSS